MKSTHYNVSDRNNKEGHLICVYDETQPCLCCELPVNSASISCTSTCGACDMGRDRSPKCRKNKWRSKDKPDWTKDDFWRNMTEQFYFDAREDADGKMYELHQQGIEGWPHVIKKVGRRRAGLSDYED